MANGKLYLIPSTLGENDPQEVLPAPVFDAIRQIKTYVVENTRSARRFLSAAGLKGHIEELNFFELNEHTHPQEVEKMDEFFKNGNNVGLISEAGLPAVADPGALLVALCHRKNIEVVPFVGPSSLMLALMSSGLNGQSFAFNGYLPAKVEERKNALKTIEKRSSSLKQTQLFIETPYRNDAMLADILSVCNGHTRLCVAVNITMPDAMIRTKTIAEWKQNPPIIGKRPCVFLILG